MKKKTKSIAQKIMAAALISAAAVVLAGCGAKNQAGDSTPAAKESGSSGVSDDAGKKGAEEETAMGRYVEASIPMPFEDGAEQVLDLIQTMDGSFELYTAKGDEGAREFKAYRYDGSSWSQEETFTAQGLPEGSSLMYSAYDKAGALYVVYVQEYTDAYLTKFPAGGGECEFTAEIEDSWVLINGLYTMDDGTTLVPSGDHVLVYDPEGKLKTKLPQRNSYSNFADSHTVTVNSFLTVGDQGFLRYDTKEWREDEVIPFQSDEMDLYGSLAAGEGDDFYLANANGIHHMAAQGTMWETIVDGSLNTMGMPSAYVKRLFAGSDNDFYLWYTESENPRMARYTYDPNMPSVPSKTITVYGLDLTDQSTIKQAASLFQMENPDTRVELIDGAGGTGGTSKMDTIRSLNAELLNGNGADVLVLDGLPADAYIEKGILADLSGVITPMKDSGELYGNIAESFTEADGTIYQYPVRVALPVIYGNKEVIGENASLESLRAWQEKNPDKTVLPKTTYENVLRQLIYLYYSELGSGTEGRLDKDKVQFLLETAKAAGDASGCRTVFEDSEDDGMGKNYNRTAVAGFTGLGDYGLMTGASEVSIEKIQSMMDVMLPYALVEKYGYGMSQFNDIYYPKGLLGVAAFSREKETAQKFVVFTLSLKVQESDLNDGFTVSKKASEAWRQRTSKISIGVSFGENGEALSAEYPNEQKKDEVMGMLDKLHTPIAVDEVLLEMIISETKGYFEGTQTAAEAAGQFENKAKLYYAE